MLFLKTCELSLNIMEQLPVFFFMVMLYLVFTMLQRMVLGRLAVLLFLSFKETSSFSYLLFCFMKGLIEITVV